MSIKETSINYNAESLAMSAKHKGRLSYSSAFGNINNKYELAIAYTPGVAEPCREIAKDTDASYIYTGRGNLVAVITDGSAVLGLGDIGGLSGMPVMEGKSALMIEFAGVNSMPLCIKVDMQNSKYEKDSAEYVEEYSDKFCDIVKALEGSWGAINLEDIKRPYCFDIEKKLKEICEIPVFHDDQHGTAIVVRSALLNASRVAGKKFEEMRVVISGSGAAGNSVCKLLLASGIKDIIMVDRNGTLSKHDNSLPTDHKELAELTGYDKANLPLQEALVGADIFIGLSAPNILKKEWIKNMADKSIICAMANPIPEIMPDDAIAGGAYIIATGRSDFPNQVNNVMAFPGIFKGALAVRASDITEGMKIAASNAIADSVENPSVEQIMPDAFDKTVALKVAVAVAEEAVRSGSSRISPQDAELAINNLKNELEKLSKAKS